MLISQRIAKDINFLKPIIEYKQSKSENFDLRLAILNSVKFIVGRELLDFDTGQTELDKRLFGRKPTDNEVQKRLDLYAVYSRLPFPNVVVENDTGLLLFISKKPLCWSMYSLFADGKVAPGYFEVQCSHAGGDIKTTTHCVASEDDFNKQFGDDKFSGWEQELKSSLGFMFLISMEILLFINVQNIKHVKYVPTKKENAMVPKPLQPKYTYHVLDLFKQKKVYASLEDIKEDLCKPRNATALRRTVLVRGHFKKRKTGIFFWDHYTRNKHNAETHGIVDKDYLVHGPNVND